MRPATLRVEGRKGAQLKRLFEACLRKRSETLVLGGDGKWRHKSYNHPGSFQFRQENGVLIIDIEPDVCEPLDMFLGSLIGSLERFLAQDMTSITIFYAGVEQPEPVKRRPVKAR